MPKRKKMAKLKRVSSRHKALHKHPSIKTIFGDVKPKVLEIEHNGVTSIIACGTVPRKALLGIFRMWPFKRDVLTDFCSHKRTIIARYNKQKKQFEIFGTCGLHLKKDSVYLQDIKNTGNNKTGMNIFRVFLNEAVNFAVEKKRGKITLEAQNQKLQAYYERFGFRFRKDGKYFPLGTFTIPKKKKGKE